jgi:amino acid transporter
VSTILVICAKLLFPKGSWSGQISFALIILAMMSGFSLQGIDMNKEVINLFSYIIIALLAFASIIGGIEFGQNGDFTPSSINSTPDYAKSLIYFYFVLAGFDTLMKFSQEAIDPDKDIPRSFYVSNALSAILTAGICFSFLVVFSNHKFHENENIVARIVASALGSSAGEVVGLLSIFLMIITGFISFLTTTRYMFGLGKEIPIMKELNEKKVPWVPVIISFVIAAFGILVNHIFTLVRISDITMTVALLLVSAATTRAQIIKGFVPIIEGLTTLSLGAILLVCFSTV